MKEDNRDIPLDSFKPSVQLYAIMGGSTDYELVGHGLLTLTSDDNEQGGSTSVIQVEGNLTKQMLVRSRIRIENNYEKQKGSVIVWADDQLATYRQVALSFEGDSECDFFWRLICQKIGKNYLDVSGRQTLDMPTEDNLAYILDRTKNAKDMIQYHILNSNTFILSLNSVFLGFKKQNDKMGMGMVGRILNSILINIDHKLVQALFRDPNFQIILEIQQFVRQVDFPQLWRDSLKIKQVIVMSQDMNNRVQIYHRVNFYRQHIIDYFKELYLEHVLVMTQYECCKDIITHLIRDSTIDDLLVMDELPAQKQKTAKTEVLMIDQFMEYKERTEKKIQFLMQTLIICRQVQNQSTRTKYLHKIYNSRIMSKITQYLDKSIMRSLDLLACIVQAMPLKFLDYLKSNFRQRPTDGLYVKLFKKFSVWKEQSQLSLIQIINHLSEPFKTKENIDFFIGTFLTYNFEYCKDERSLLLLLSQITQMVQNIEPIMQQAIKSNVFSKLVTFIRNLRKDKVSELRVSKVMKRILIENTGSNSSFQRVFLNQLNNQVVSSGFFECSMLILEKNISYNNIISSSLLQNLKILKMSKRLTPFHQYLNENYSQNQSLHKYIEPILAFKPETDQITPTNNPSSHQHDLEQQMEENYLLTDNVQEVGLVGIVEQANSQLNQLKRIREEIKMEELIREEEELKGIERLSKKIKLEAAPQIQLEINLAFDDFVQGNQ